MTVKHKMDDRAASQEKVRQAIIDFVNFEDETSQIWSWAISAEELLLSEDTLQSIAKTVRPDKSGEYNTDDLYDAISQIIGVNPTLQ